jgi:hypothetical protein
MGGLLKLANYYGWPIKVGQIIMGGLLKLACQIIMGGLLKLQPIKVAPLKLIIHRLLHAVTCVEATFS